MASGALEEENKALRTKLSVLERELKLRSAECVELRQNLQELSRVKQTNDSQQEVITRLRSKLEFTTAAHASALEMIEKLKKELREKEHRERVDCLNARLNEHDPSPDSGALKATTHNTTASVPTSNASGGVVLTSSGPQIICKSSGISSIGFAHVPRPVDFLGGVQKRKQQQQQAVDGEEDEVARVMEMAKEEAMMDIRYAEVEDHEEKELRERFNALRHR
ncbi:hypothetical protein LSM04_003252 [Trypanosoma melophagium]|uniref:uncharacterized protein n=1 Tax=Trypanosoma melophagium TaxID=715481 RepID=UPI00351A861B|nr:hypothetical protein LSM04_003252 [Trypanosoma melophagium]